MNEGLLMFLDLSKAFDLVGDSTLHCKFIVNFNYLGFTNSINAMLTANCQILIRSVAGSHRILYA